MSEFLIIKVGTIDKFLELVSSGITKTEAANVVERDLYSIRLWLKHNGIVMPDNSSPITALVMSHADVYASGCMTQVQIATTCGCSKPYFSKYLSEYTAAYIHTKQDKILSNSLITSSVTVVSQKQQLAGWGSDLIATPSTNM